MPANFCLLPDQIENFKKELKNKKVGVLDLMNMESGKRTEFFKKFAGESASDINLAFEQKLILKHNTLGVVNLLKKLTESGKYKPSEIARLQRMKTAFRAAQQERVFSPEEGEVFLQAEANKLFGSEITETQAREYYALHKKTQESFRQFDHKLGEWKSETAAKEFGARKVIEDRYKEALKDPNKSIKESLRGVYYEFRDTAQTNKPKAVVDILGTATKTVFDNMIALVASVDNSFIGRQGLSTLFTNPSVWFKGAKQSFIDFSKTVTGHAMDDALLADVYSKPNYANGAYEKAGFLKGREEQFPTTFPERIPGLGRLFKASEVAFSNSALNMRTKLYDLLADQQQKMGVDMKLGDNQKALGQVISSLTARGQWGARGESPAVKLALWAPRMLKGNLDVLTAHTGQDMPIFARRIAQKNLLKIVGGTALILGTMKAINPDGVDLDPRSSHFGKVKVGGSWVDITGGKASIIVLATRLLLGLAGKEAVKNSTTGVTSKLNTGEFGGKTVFDVFADFLTGKTSPGMGVVVDLMKGKTFKNEKPSFLNELYARGVPISVQNSIAIKEADQIYGVLADYIGFNADSREYSNKNWDIATSKELEELRNKIGDDEFKKANEAFNNEVNDLVSERVKQDDYQSMSNEDKKKEITKLQKQAKTKILNQYK